MLSHLIDVSENKNKTMIDILTVISQSEEWYSLKDVSEEVNLSVRSVQRYINAIYDTIDEYDKKKNHFCLSAIKIMG